MMTMGPVTPARSSAVLDGLAGGVPVLFNPVDRRLHVLNDTAAAVWDALGEPTTLGGLADDLAAAFGASASIVRGDVERMLGQFIADGLVGDGARSTKRRPRPERPDGPTAVRLLAAGTVVDVIVAPGALAAAVSRILTPLTGDGEPDGWIHATPDELGMWNVTTSIGGEQRVGTEMGAALRVVSEVNNIVVAAADEKLVMHAGAVARNGRAVVLPGSSNRGKSTLTAALVRGGLGYLTDEAAVIDEHGRCGVFAKAIALDPGSFSLFPELRPLEGTTDLDAQIARREWHVPPNQIGAVADPAAVHAIVCPHWRAGSATRLARLTPTEALHSLLSDTFDFGAGGQDVFDILTGLVTDVPVYRLGYGDLNEAVAVVGDLLG